MDIDKKIAEKPLIFRAKDGRMYYKVEFADYDQLIAQLKEYRVARTMLLPNAKAQAARELYYIAQLRKCREDAYKYYKMDEWKHSVEQRTKDDCIDAGWKWIAEKYSHYWIQAFPEKHFESFKQAIDSAGGKP